MADYPDSLLFINGTWQQGSEKETLPVTDPASDRQIGRASIATTRDLDAAAEAADRAFPVWRETSAFERGRILRVAAALIRERSETNARIMTLEQGKPLREARAELNTAADVFDWCAEEARRTYGQVVPARAPGVLQITLKVPVGPTAAFTPWNFPVNQAARKLGAALAAGCTVVLKAAEETPASAMELVRCLHDAGLPSGVVNLVFGVPAEISGHLIPHPAIRKISFTGSTPVGKQLAAMAGLHMKRATMELGGHAPVIVAADADISQAVDLMIQHKFRNAGQVCVSPSRFLIEDSVADAFIQSYTERAAALKVGSGLDETTQMGPVIGPRRVGAMEEMLADALDCGAALATGGRRVGNVGSFFEPTVLVDAPISARIMNEEPFGPIAIVNRVASVDEAIAEANRLPVGLAAYAFTTNLETAERMTAEVRAGMLSINHLGIGLPELHFGGIGDSGYGSEGGSDMLDAYLDTRMITRR